MASTDRAFRALARAEPDLVLALLRIALPRFMAESAVGAETVEDPKLDLPPPREADLVARAGTHELLHVEGQGYKESDFESRVFRYHLLLVLRHPERRVRTVALWLTRPSERQRLDVIEHNGVRIDVSTVVLAELSAWRLLDNPDTVCFAPGADAEGRPDPELCARVAQALAAQNAGWQRLLLCVAVAAAAGRYDAMIQAMTDVDLEPPIIEDLVRYGRERGRREGEEIGVERGRRESLLDLVAARGFALTLEQRARVDGEHDVERLARWLRRAVAARDVGEIFAD